MQISEAIIVAIITGIVSVLGNVIANSKAMAVVQTKIEMLTEEVRKHNNFAQRIPLIEERISVANHRIDDLERKTQ